MDKKDDKQITFWNYKRIFDGAQRRLKTLPR